MISSKIFAESNWYEVKSVIKMRFVKKKFAAFNRYKVKSSDKIQFLIKFSQRLTGIR